MDNFEMNDSFSRGKQIENLKERVQILEGSVSVLQDTVIRLLVIVDRLQQSENA